MIRTFRRGTPALLVLVLVLVAAACSSGGGSSSTGGGKTSGGPVKEGGTLRIGTASGIDSLNPFVAFQQDSFSTFEYIYPTLVQYDTKTLDFKGDFAKSWDVSSDNLTYTFHTIPNAKWSDGQPLTAKDAEFTFNTIIKYGNGPTANYIGDFAHVDSVTAPDDNTLVIKYKEPVANVLANLQQVFILPQHVWGKFATGNGKELKTTPNEPENGQPLVSGGPFMLAKYQRKAIALFQKNPNFYGPQPHIDGFGLQFFANSDAEVTALKNGDIDAMATVPPTDVDTVKSAGLNLFNGPGLEFHDFIINSNPKKTDHRELLDPKVKEAFEAAIDRDQIVKTAWLGLAAPGSTIVPPGAGPWHDDGVQPTPFDLDHANQLLDDAGFQKGSDGVRVADGHPMAYDVIFPHDEQGPGDRVFQIIQNDFSKIGVKLTQRTMDDTAAFDAITEPNNQYLNFDLAMWDWVPLEDPDFILSVLTCDQYGGWSDSGYCNPAYDKLYQEQGVATSDAARKKIVDQMQEMIARDRPYIVLSYDRELDAWSKSWDGFVESNQGFFNPLSKESLTEVHQV